MLLPIISPSIPWLKLSKSIKTCGPKAFGKVPMCITKEVWKLLCSWKLIDLSLCWHPPQCAFLIFPKVANFIRFFCRRVWNRRRKKMIMKFCMSLMTHTTYYWFDNSPRRRRPVKLHVLLYLWPAHSREYPNVQM